MRQVVPSTGPKAPTELILASHIEPCIRRLRSFLSQLRIEKANEQIIERADGSRFRDLVLKEKQPWPDVFNRIDRKSLSGARAIPLREISQSMALAAMAGRMLGRIEPTLTPRVADKMRDRMLDLDGRTHPVLMEWSAAYFYLCRGHRVIWTEPNVAGPEFVCAGSGHAFEVECKRITRKSKEKLNDRHALTLAEGVLQSIVAQQLSGDVVLDSNVLESPPVADVAERVTIALLNTTDLSNIDIHIAGVGRLTGDLSRLGPGSGWAQRGNIERRMAACPHDHRGFAVAIPHAYAPHPEATVLWLRGPRCTQQEHIDHITKAALNGAQQLTGNRMGFVIIEVEDVTDVTLFRDRAAFRDINQKVFAEYPAVAAVTWQGDRRMIPSSIGFNIAREAFVERNSASSFDASAVPLLD